MEITKTHHESGLGIYAKSLPVKTKEEWKQAKEVSREMQDWMNETNGKFKGEHPKAFAMAHCQVVEHDHPIRLFVVASDLVAPKFIPKDNKQTLENTFFEAQSIFNAEILEAPKTIVRGVPERKVTRDPKDKTKVEVEIVKIDKKISNVIEVPEGCMSFGHRKAKNVKRCYGIRVRYQYLKKGLFGEKVATFEGWVEGLKAHIFQHECDHFDTKNIFFKS
jgi:hypothetical protein